MAKNLEEREHWKSVVVIIVGVDAVTLFSCNWGIKNPYEICFVAIFGCKTSQLFEYT